MIHNVRMTVMASAFSALIALGAWIAIPVGPVPITLQILFVHLTGILLPVKQAALSVLLYIFLGIIGLPVFAGGRSGIGNVLGPMGGYLPGFLLAAIVISALTAKIRNHRIAPSQRVTRYAWLALSCLVGSFLILACGAIWGKVSTGLPWREVCMGWVLPFIPGDALKIALAAVIGDAVIRRNLLASRYQ